ncbi:MAG: hypothetical protein ACJAUV_001143 [Flavobacteriales bacterium]|jgi:hypothetical protein
MKSFSFLLFLTLMSLGCDQQGGIEETPVARVYDKYLYKSDLVNAFTTQSNSLDSAKAASKFIDDWVKEQTIVYNAEYNLPEEKQNFDKQLTNYKNSLLKYTYESQLINQKLDTTITDSEIEGYYNINYESFKLKDYAVRVSFIQLSSELNNLGLAESLFRSSRPEDHLDLEDFCTQYATSSYFDNGDDWLYLNKVLKEVPLEVGDYPDRYLYKNKFVKIRQEKFVYLVQIHDYLKISEPSPLSIEKERIKNSIINKRKMDLLTKIRYDLYAKANNNKEIEIY